MGAFYNPPIKKRLFAGKFWNSFFTCVQFACILFCLYWCQYKHLPSTGVAVAVIGVAAAAMSVHNGMEDWQKGLWMLIITSLLVTELRSIKKDKLESHEQYLKDRKAQDDAFAVVLKKQNEQFSATKTGFDATKTGFDATEIKVGNVLTETQRVDALARENLLNITASDSFAIVYPEFVAGSSEGYWKVHNYGKHSLFGVEATIFVVKAGHVFVGGDIDAQMVESNPIVIGNVPGAEGRQLPVAHKYFTPQIRNDGTCEFVIYVTSQSYSTSEIVYVKPSFNGYVYSLVAWRNLDAKDKKPGDLPTKNQDTVTRVLKNIPWTPPRGWKEEFKLP